jgi:hypothetical protein
VNMRLKDLRVCRTVLFMSKDNTDRFTAAQDAIWTNFGATFNSVESRLNETGGPEVDALVGRLRNEILARDARTASHKEEVSA